MASKSSTAIADQDAWGEPLRQQLWKARGGQSRADAWYLAPVLAESRGVSFQASTRLCPSEVFSRVSTVGDDDSPVRF